MLSTFVPKEGIQEEAKPCFDLNSIYFNAPVFLKKITGVLVEEFELDDIIYWIVKVENKGYPYLTFNSLKWNRIK